MPNALRSHRSQGAGKTAAPSLHRLIDDQRDALDRLSAELSLGIRNQRHYDELEEQAGAICTGLRAAFRTGRRG
ncbi:MAG: hypothetical protein WA908_01580 [Pontixanthobacter sp.]